MNKELEILTGNEVDRIHAATIEVYDRAGIKVWSPEAFQLFVDAGVRVDEKKMTVHPTESFTKDILSTVPKEFCMYGRDPSHKLLLGTDKVYFSLMAEAAKVEDLEGNVRAATMKDVGNLAKLSDWCENIHHTSQMTTPSDVSQDEAHIHMLWANLRNSRKTSDGYCYSAKNAREELDLAAIVRGGEEELRKMPMLLSYNNPVSPLQLSGKLAEGSIVWARRNQPVMYAPEALAGGTAPATLAGLLVQQNAEVLSGIMMAQLANSGAPVMYGTVSAVLDMRYGVAALGSPEVGLLNLATAQMARHYRIPSRGTGGNTDSKLVDAQSGLETALSLYAAALAGMNFIYDSAGSIEGSLTTSYAKVIIDNDVCGMVARLLEGIKVNDETLAVDEICKAGASANFLGTPFTLRHFRKEHFIPSLLDRKTRDAWMRDGGKNIAEAAREKAKQVLREHEVPPIDSDVVKAVEEHMKKVLKTYS